MDPFGAAQQLKIAYAQKGLVLTVHELRYAIGGADVAGTFKAIAGEARSAHLALDQARRKALPAAREEEETEPEPASPAKKPAPKPKAADYDTDFDRQPSRNGSH